MIAQANPDFWTAVVGLGAAYLFVALSKQAKATRHAHAAKRSTPPLAPLLQGAIAVAFTLTGLVALAERRDSPSGSVVFVVALVSLMTLRSLMTWGEQDHDEPADG